MDSKYFGAHKRGVVLGTSVVIALMVVLATNPGVVVQNVFNPLGTNVGTKVEFTVAITHQEQRFANLGFILSSLVKGEIWSPNCWAFCTNGVTYTLDPTTLITNRGHDFEQCKVFGSAGTITCTAADTATVIYISSNNVTPTTSDTTCASAITSGGLSAIAGTVTAAAAGQPLTTTITRTFTAAETDSSVQLSCLQTEVSNGTNIVLYAEGTFGPDSLVSGNTLQITWTISRN